MKKQNISPLWSVVAVILVGGYFALSNEKNTEPKTTNSEPKQKVTFVDSDFYWDENTRPHKDVIINGVTMVAANNPRCKNPDPGSAYISSSKGTPNNPVFYVSCESHSGSFNVFFSASDVSSGSIATSSYIPRSAAMAACQQAVKDKLNVPSSLDFSALGAAVTQHPNGNTTIVADFSAENVIGTERDHRIKCLFDSSGLIESTITPL